MGRRTSELGDWFYSLLVGKIRSEDIKILQYSGWSFESNSLYYFRDITCEIFGKMEQG